MTSGARRPSSGVRLHVVSGKGGTGKTTVAAGLALALASAGKNVMVCEVEGRQGLASLFDVAPLPYAERRVAVGPDNGGTVCAMAIDAEAALLDYLDSFYRLGRAGRTLDRFGVIDFATTIAPGLRDVLLIGKVYEVTRRQVAGRPAYDAVVLDAPPTGRIARFLNVNTEVAGVAQMGPIRRQADSIMQLLTSEQTRVHLVSVLEEMPVQETLDAVGELRRLRLRPGAIVVNRVRAPELAPEALAAAADRALDTGRLEASLASVGVKSEPDVIAGLLDVAQQHAERVALEIEQRRRLDAVGAPVVSLPFFADGVDLGALYELAADLRASGEF